MALVGAGNTRHFSETVVRILDLAFNPMDGSHVILDNRADFEASNP